ncbi:hypothetical protein [Acinetobacter sp. YH12035]|uniref:hypothetical protein n=1 Tax=Acinetobacter sp. YH12035 TaxID=2601045 RepID=UPI0015D1D601|nr:hypothetical protein [Acinetobacter sp. YH12035]
MAMKQTQTKIFKFSDVDLDFSASSKSLFPSRFKKMLSDGYNEQTVISVSISENQVTFTYGGAHGYSDGRVLKVDSGALALINSGEFWIDSVTPSTVTFTLDEAPPVVSGGFKTRIAPIGFELVYEQGLVQVYKFKHIDDTDLYLRMLFMQPVQAGGNYIIPCIAKSYDPDTGFITDPFAYQPNKEVVDWSLGTKWLFTSSSGATNSHTFNYSQGASTYGDGIVMGSLYHLVTMSNGSSSSRAVNGILPCETLEIESLDYPLLMGPNIEHAQGTLSSTTFEIYTENNNQSQGVLGNYRVMFFGSGTPTTPNATASALPEGLQPFNVATANTITLYERASRQIIGYVTRGLYLCQFSSSNTPPTVPASTPSLHYDYETLGRVYIHNLNKVSNGGASNGVFFAAPIEDVKNG